MLGKIYFAQNGQHQNMSGQEMYSVFSNDQLSLAAIKLAPSTEWPFDFSTVLYALYINNIDCTIV